METIELFTQDDVAAALKLLCNREGGQALWAGRNGVNVSLVCDVLAGRRKPNDTMLAALGYERVTGWRVKGEGE